jgi:hypothetical protein
MRPRLLFTIALQCAFVLACSDSTAPNHEVRVDRLYLLESVDGHTLPTAAYGDTTGSLDFESGFLELRPDGGARVSTVERVLFGDTVSIFTNLEPLQYSVYGDSIEVYTDSKCLCVFPRYGIFTDTVITLTVGGAGSVFRYRITG